MNLPATKILWGQIFLVSTTDSRRSVGRYPVDGVAAWLSTAARTALVSVEFSRARATMEAVHERVDNVLQRTPPQVDDKAV
jgi:hypothetical protein